MKRLAMTVGIWFLVAAVSLPAFAWGFGHGHGRGMGPQDGGAYAGLTDEQKKQLTDLDTKFRNDTSALRGQLWSRQGEMSALMDSSNPDPEKAKALQKEIGELQAKMGMERLKRDLEAKKIAPDLGMGRGMGRGPCMGAGMGQGMGPGAQGMGMMGKCWN